MILDARLIPHLGDVYHSVLKLLNPFWFLPSPLKAYIIKSSDTHTHQI